MTPLKGLLKICGAMKWTAQRVRDTFLRFFEERGHTVVPSSPLLPHGDPTLLFTNAGMNQFKPYFLGEVEPPFRRAASVQKCLRAGGKHNDLENVGFTRRHHTFFEMLGNFSFGDYFKREAILWAWELITRVFGLDPDRLWVSVYEEDDEAYEIWAREVGVPEGRILRLGKKDNFWEMGDVGPCGPCSEIHYDLGPEFDPRQRDPGQEGERFLELWNLVFMQYERKPDGTLVPLPKKNIDTGMGLERLLAVLQGVDSNFHTDLFMPLIEEVERITSVAYDPGEKGAPHRVLADHARALTFAIADGIYPSNFGRGYVLRRILRRAHRFAQRIGVQEAVLYRLVPVVVHIMKSAYPELVAKKADVELIVKQEEERFIQTLARNLPRLEEVLRAARGTGVVPGEAVFQLYDTYGIPLDMVEEAAREAHLRVDWEAFEELMARQREQARKSQAGVQLPEFQVLDPEYQGSEFVGYETLQAQSTLAKWAQKGQEYFLVFHKTPFYARGGGQEGDHGRIFTEDVEFEVLDTFRVGRDIVHRARLRRGQLDPEAARKMLFQLQVDEEWRRGAMRAHTATHLMHAALREVLGEHVRQQGSLVEPDRTRFDFTHPVALTEEQIQAIEDRVNEKILENCEIVIQWMAYQRALEEGAIAFFEEKYGDRVRVVSCGDYSKELCGGTHVRRTGDIGLFVIVKEEASSAGVRRIDAYTGKRARRFLRERWQLLRETARRLQVEEPQVPQKVERLQQQLKEAEQRAQRLMDRYAREVAQKLFQQARRVGEAVVVVARLADLDGEGIKRVSDFLVETSSGPVVLFLVGEQRGRPVMFARVSPELTERVQARTLIQRAGRFLQGGGGGTAERAEGGGRTLEQVDQALSRVLQDILQGLQGADGES